MGKLDEIRKLLRMILVRLNEINMNLCRIEYKLEEIHSTIRSVKKLIKEKEEEK